MANQKLTDLGTVTTLADGDLVYAVDVSDTTDDPAGSSKGIAKSNLRDTLLSGLAIVEEIDRTTLVTAGEFDFTIPSGYDKITIEGIVETDRGAAGTVYWIANTDTTVANYLTSVHQVYNGSNSAAEQVTPAIAYHEGSGMVTGVNLSASILEPDGSQAKSITCISHSEVSAGNIANNHYVNVSSVTAALTRVRIRDSNHATNGLTGTVIIYGHRTLA